MMMMLTWNDRIWFLPSIEELEAFKKYWGFEFQNTRNFSQGLSLKHNNHVSKETLSKCKVID